MVVEQRLANEIHRMARNEKLDMVQLELGDLRGVEQWPREASFTIE